MLTRRVISFFIVATTASYFLFVYGYMYNYTPPTVLLDASNLLKRTKPVDVIAPATQSQPGDVPVRTPTTIPPTTLFPPPSFPPPPSPSPSPSPSYTSFLEHVPNEIASNVFWSLRNVSYKDGIVFFHSPAPIDKEIMTSKYYHTKGDLPWSGEDSSMPPRIKQIVFTDETFDESKCATVETRSIVFARVNHKSNCFACNQGHLIINMINPLFLYLFYIREVSERERRRRRCIFAMKCAKLNLLRYSQI